MHGLLCFSSKKRHWVATVTVIAAKLHRLDNSMADRSAGDGPPGLAPRPRQQVRAAAQFETVSWLLGIELCTQRQLKQLQVFSAALHCSSADNFDKPKTACSSTARLVFCRVLTKLAAMASRASHQDLQQDQQLITEESNK